MSGRLFRRDRESDAIATGLYGAIVAQARTPALYTGFGVADTVDGRFEMVVLHTILVLDRLGRGGDHERGLAQRIFDLYTVDMDRSLRELGVGDLGVPKRMKAMAERFYGRAAVYRAALAAGDREALTDALSRNVFGRSSAGADPLAAYALACHDALAATADDSLLTGAPRFADPSSFLLAGTPS